MKRNLNANDNLSANVKKQKLDNSKESIPSCYERYVSKRERKQIELKRNQALAIINNNITTTLEKNNVNNINNNNNNNNNKNYSEPAKSSLNNGENFEIYNEFNSVTLNNNQEKVQKKDRILQSNEKIPSKTLSFIPNAHTNGVTSLLWTLNDSKYLLSGGNDGKVKIWNIFDLIHSEDHIYHIDHLYKSNPHSEEVYEHGSGVRDMSLSSTGLLTCSYDKTVQLSDLPTKTALLTFPHEHYVNAVRWSPSDHNLFISSDSGSNLFCWDIRTQQIIRSYKGVLGEVQSVEFINEGVQFVTSNNVTRKNTTDKSIVVWDFESGATISNQIYPDIYSCPRLKVHPSGDYFVAQSTDNYIPVFSTHNTFKMNKKKRFEGAHFVSGYRIGLDFSPSGRWLCSGSSDGSIAIYDWNTSKVARRIRVHSDATVDVKYHPKIEGVIAAGCWNGSIALLH